MAKNKKHKKLEKLVESFNKPKLKNAILPIFYDHPERTYNYKQIAELLKISDPEITKLVFVVLEELTETKNLRSVQRGKYKLESRSGAITGKVELQPQGYAYIISEEFDKPVLVTSRNLNHAMEGDTVKVQLFAIRKKQQVEGEVIEIVERAKSTFVGTISKSRNFAFFIPTGKVGFDLFIPNEKLNGAEDGQKAIAKITEWPANAKKPVWRNY